MSDRELIARLAHALRVQIDGVNLYPELLAEADARQAQFEAVGPDHTTETLPDGAIRVCVGGRCGTVSSWHLVEGKAAQLRRLPPAPEQLEQEADA